jgi:hypothetical protein
MRAWCHDPVQGGPGAEAPLWERSHDGDQLPAARGEGEPKTGSCGCGVGGGARVVAGHGGIGSASMSLSSVDSQVKSCRDGGAIRT